MTWSSLQAAGNRRLSLYLIIGLVVSLAFAVLMIGTWSLDFLRRKLTAVAGESLQLEAAHVGDILKLQLSERRSDILVLAGSPVFQQGTRTQQQAFLDRFKELHPVYTWLAITDSRGLVVAATDHIGIGTDQSKRKEFRLARDNDGVQFTDVSPDEYSAGMDVVGLAAAIKSLEGDFTGVVMTRLNLRELEALAVQTVEWYQKRAESLGELEYQVLDETGVPFIDSDLLHKGHVNLRQMGVTSALLSAMGMPGYTQEEHIRRHVPVLTGYAKIESPVGEELLNWAVLVRADLSSVLAPISAVVWHVGLVGLSLFLPLVVSLIWLAVRLQRQWATVDHMAKQKAEVLATVEAFFVGVNAQGVVTEWTARAESLFGIALPAALGRPFAGLAIQWNWEPVLEALRRAGDERKAVRLDRIRFTAQEGKERFLRVTVSPLFGDRGVDYILMGEDVTERLLLEHDLAQAQKLESVGRLAAGIAHEINTPIQFVGDNVRFLSESFRDVLQVVEQQRAVLGAAKGGACSAERIAACEAAATAADLDYLAKEIPKSMEQSVEGIERVAKIVRAMKDFAHPGKNEKTAVDLNKAIESTVTVARNEWKYIADLELKLDPALPPVPCLAGEFNQVILNMIINAAHAIADVVQGTGQKGTITITTAQAGDCAEVRVADTGTGIPEAIRHKIFDPFFTTKEVGKGTGQGLAIARSVVVDKHGGTIRVESDVGIGTTFIIRLPLAMGSTEQAMEQAA